jgi:hypothetical protein
VKNRDVYLFKNILEVLKMSEIETLKECIKKLAVIIEPDIETNQDK